MLITIFWLIGITNAINLLDNMDGLATGIAAIASGFLTLNFIAANQTTEALMLGVFAAALIGFLIYNSNPASIFMGDSGSMFIGFFLASSSLINLAGGRSRAFVPVLAVPILVLFIPIFDTTFVTILRKLSGRAASQGGRDHTSHRLVALGLSEKRAVMLLYGLAALSGLLAVTLRQLKPDVSIALLAIFTLGLTLLGVYLAGVKGYDEEEQVRAERDRPLDAFLIDFSYKRRVFEVLLAGSRVAFRFFRQVLPSGSAGNGRRVLIYGAGDAGELLLRELMNNRELSYAPVGFMDDDVNKHGKLIHGFRVFGGNGLLPKIIKDHRVEQVLISTPRISEERIAEILSECEARNIELRRLSIRLETISDNPLKSASQMPMNGDL